MVFPITAERLPGWGLLWHRAGRNTPGKRLSPEYAKWLRKKLRGCNGARRMNNRFHMDSRSRSGFSTWVLRMFKVTCTTSISSCQRSFVLCYPDSYLPEKKDQPWQESHDESFLWQRQWVNFPQQSLHHLFLLFTELWFLKQMGRIYLIFYRETEANGET